MNQKVRKLVHQLGKAIHESVSGSEQIAGVVADIRGQGFEVVLMLEATIGLNEIEEQPAGAVDPSTAGLAEAGEHGPFTAQDLHFLKSLRISVSGENVPARDEPGGPLDEPDETEET